MIKQLTMLQGSLRFAKLIGVRDLVWAAQRTGTSPQDPRLSEQDMSDMFWEIPSPEAKQAVLWAVGEYKKRRRGTRLWFSLSREARSLDRVGKSSHRQFRVLSEEEVTRFVDYDLFDNVLFVLQRLVLQEIGSGVPIGGFISAQLAELWALWRENVKLRGEDAVRQGFESDWNRATHSDPPLFESVKPLDGHPRPNMQGSVSGKTDFSMSPDTSDTMQVCGNMMRSPAPHLVSWPALSEAGFQGWWSPVESLVSALQVGDRPVMFLRSTPWDGAREGRLRVIL